MARAGGNPDFLKPPFSSTNQPANRGRKRSKVKAFIKDWELSSVDISDLAKTVLQLNDKEVKDLAVNKKAPMVARLFARYMLEDMKQGYAKNVQMLLDRAVGKLPDKVQQTGENTLIIKREIVKPDQAENDT